MQGKLMNKRVFALVALMTVLATVAYVPMLAQSADASAVSATVDIRPNTLNLKSKGRWITALIQLPEGYSLGSIDITTLKLNDTITAVWVGIDQNRNVMIVRFRRSEVISLIRSASILDSSKVGNATFILTGSLANDASFEGGDTIRVMSPGKYVEHEEQGTSSGNGHAPKGPKELPIQAHNKQKT